MRRDRKRRTQAALAGGTALLLLGWPSSALAHGVVVDHEQVDAVRIDARYDTGEPMADAQVSVYSPEDASEPWLSGSVDDDGVFLFEPDGAGTWRVEVRQAGHGETVRVEVEEPSGEDSPGEVELTEAEERQAPVPEERSPEERSGASGGETAGTGVLQTVVMGALAVWALVATALYFAGRRRT